MQNIGIITTNIMGILILWLMLKDFGARNYGIRRTSADDRLFFYIALVNILLFLFDSVMLAVDGQAFPGALMINRTAAVIYFTLHPVIALLFLVYAEHMLKGEISRIRRAWWAFCAPVALVFAASVYSCFHPALFYVDTQNVYARGPLFWVFMVMCLAYFGDVYFAAAKKTGREGSENHKMRVRYLKIYPLFPLAGAALQGVFFGISVIWIGAMISLLVIYFNLQNAQITTDALTGLNNRRSFINFMSHRLQNGSGDKALFLFMIDVDDFKHINDEYGHVAGDTALRQVAQLLIRAVRRSDFIARVGGDEFVVVGERDTQAMALASRQAIWDEFESFNQKEEHPPYTLMVSIGYAVLPCGGKCKLDDLMLIADRDMYRVKSLHDARRANGEQAVQTRDAAEANEDGMAAHRPS